MNVDSIVAITISASAGAVSRLGFGIPLIWGHSAIFTSGTLREYSSIDAVVVDFATSTLEYKEALNLFSQSPSLPLVKIGQYTTIDTDYTALKLVDSDFYFVINCSRAKADILALAALVETDKKLHFAVTLDADVPTATSGNVALTLSAAKRERTILFYTPTDQYQCSAWIGKVATYDPGSATWMFKQVSGVTPDSLNDTIITNLIAANCNFYTATSGINMYANGVVASGEYIDIIQGTDWIQINMQADVLQALVDNPKIPFTDKGGDVMYNIINARLKQAIGQGILAEDPAPVITIPKVADISTVNRAARFFAGCKFTANYAGAIQKVGIAGQLSV